VTLKITGIDVVEAEVVVVVVGATEVVVVDVDGSLEFLHVEHKTAKTNTAIVRVYRIGDRPSGSVA